MQFDEWAPAYHALRTAFGFDRRGDERARDQLHALVHDQTPLASVDTLAIEGADVAIAGAGPTLHTDHEQIEAADVVIAASDAGHRLATMGYRPALIVTDLDGAPAETLALAQAGIPVAIHAHGDNRSAIDHWVPKFPSERLIPTTQVAPRGVVRNFGGFTDGDRAAFLADHVGATTLSFPGWQLTGSSVGKIKQHKLDWAAKLLYWLECRRETQFALLDGIRETITLSWYSEDESR